jgi:DUF218 domain
LADSATSTGLIPTLPLSLLKRRTIPVPTLLGWVCLLGIIIAPCACWWFRGESFLSVTERRPAEILVVEGWIGREALRAAAIEFREDGARIIVTTGALSNERWSEHRYSYADMARFELIQAGVPADRILAAPAVQVETQRTFEMAAAAFRVISATGSPVTAVNVFTIGPHARRSRMVFRKVFQPGIKVGVVSWAPPNYSTERWWHSSERAGDFLKETACYFFEAVVDSGRNSNVPASR